MSKPTLFSPIAVFPGFVGFIGVALWLCLHPEILFVVFLLAPALGLMTAGLAKVCSPAPRRQTPPPSTPPPARQPDTLTLLLVGVALGRWLGSGPSDGSGISDR